MKYRNFGKFDFKPSALGFGAMRLPLVREGAPESEIDEKKATEMLYFAIDNGVNYLDTAYVYHKGQSEVFLGKILTKNYREKVKIASKLSLWNTENKNDPDKLLEEQLRRLRTDQVDFYLLHGLNKERWEKVKNLEIIEWAGKKIAEGKIGHLGFSFHDEYSLFQEIVDSYDKWTFCQIQYNFLDENFEAGTKGLKYASQKGLGVVVMEPLRGGKLANPPREVKEIWNKAEPTRTPVDWALQWLWNQPEVSLVLSGMSSLEQVKENIGSADRSKVNSLTPAELMVFGQVKQEYTHLTRILQ